MIAETLNCQSCGASVASNAHQCQHCGSRLAAIACPGCLRMMFQGSKFCPHCGRMAVQWQPTASPLPCPGCETPMLRGEAGAYALHECPQCFGIWVDKDTLEHLCRAAEREAIPPDPLGSLNQPRSIPLAPVRYVRCPQCRELMHRVNFARQSGIVVDVCRAHGTWFEAQELQRLVEFIRSGGLDRVREREKAELVAERRRRHLASAVRSAAPPTRENRDLLTCILSAARGLFDVD